MTVREALSLAAEGVLGIDPSYCCWAAGWRFELRFCGLRRDGYEFGSINYSHLGNRPVGLVMIPVQGGVRNGLVETQSAARALPTFVSAAMSLPAFIHPPIIATLGCHALIAHFVIRRRSPPKSLVSWFSSLLMLLNATLSFS